MRFGDVFRSALTNLRRQKLRTTLTVFAVFIGALSVTVMLTLVTSAQDFANSQVTSNGQDHQVAVTSQPDVKFREALMGNGANQGESSSFVLSDQVATQIAAIPGVDGVVRLLFPQVFDHVAVGGQEHRLEGGVVAYEPSDAVGHTMVAGRWVDAAGDPRAIAISSSQAKSWGFSNPADAVGKSVDLVTREWYQGTGSADPPQGDGSQGKNGSGPTTFTVKIVGVTDQSDDNVINPTWSFAKELSTQREWNKAPDGRTTSTIVSTIPTQGYGALLAVAASTDEVDRIAADIRRLGAGTAVAKDQIDDQKRAFRVIGFVLGGIGAIALLVAAIGVVNTMVMSILERTREIGVMRAVGASRAAVRRLFTLEAALLGFFGGVVGVAVAYGISALANPIVNDQLSRNGLTSRNIISVPPLLGIAVIVITTIIGVLAGLYPAARAARMDPVAALRAE